VRLQGDDGNKKSFELRADPKLATSGNQTQPANNR
jgi:hypothetical protein